jgi:hypothetical protein
VDLNLRPSLPGQILNHDRHDLVSATGTDPAKAELSRGRLGQTGTPDGSKRRVGDLQGPRSPEAKD